MIPWATRMTPAAKGTRRHEEWPAAMASVAMRTPPTKLVTPQATRSRLALSEPFMTPTLMTSRCEAGEERDHAERSVSATTTPPLVMTEAPPASSDPRRSLFRDLVLGQVPRGTPAVGSAATVTRRFAWRFRLEVRSEVQCVPGHGCAADIGSSPVRLAAPLSRKELHLDQGGRDHVDVSRRVRRRRERRG
jgi:hypothetical protein